jgi:uncharacterized repeat protein (TIGR01451 family)
MERPTDVPARRTVTPEPATATDLRMEKLVDRAVALPGETLVFTLRISTTAGGTVMRDVVVRDLVPAPLIILGITSERGEIVASGNTVTAFPSVLAPNETVLIRITVRVPDDAAPGTVLNTATVTTSTLGDDPANNRSTVTVEISRRPQEPNPTPPPPPAWLPVTNDPTTPTGILVFLPWLLVGVLLVALGGAFLVLRRYLGTRRTSRPVQFPDPAVPGAASARVSPVITAPPPAPTGIWRGPALPTAGDIGAMPPVPGTYLDSEAPRE